MLDTVQKPATRLADEMARVGSAMDALFSEHLEIPADGSGRLVEAMRYAAIGGGKRLRPLLVVAGAALHDVPEAQALRVGLAVECVHVHSLVHDDLPCMDDDDLRRGRATVHRAFDEATALLAGDALHALAFEVLADRRTHPDGGIRAELAATLARAAGARGMAGGQMLDLLAERGGGMGALAVAHLQRLKTGALISWSLEAGAILGRADEEQSAQVRAYGRCIGLAFQIADDLIDFEGDERLAGKRVGKDAARGKQSFVSLLGAARARAQAEELAAEAVAHLRPFGPRGALLADLSRFVIRRDR